MWLGVAAAAVLGLPVGIGLRVPEQSLPERRQEMLETPVAVVACVVVTWMIVWMRRHSRGLREDLRMSTSAAPASAARVRVARTAVGGTVAS